MNGKERLDILLVKRNLISSRERAKTTIMAGLVLVDGQKIDKPGTFVKETAELRILGNDNPYVSRGGLKLEKAIKEFEISLIDKIVADIGASTGGFTDCALKNNAKKVYSIDVGYGQLAWSLRTDARVINMERTNIKNVLPDMLDDKIDFATVDVSFISLTKVLSVVKELLCPTGEIIALIKPQFEAGRENVGKKGVVRSADIHIQVIKNITEFVRQIGLIPLNLTYSPIKGPEGNIEYLIQLSRSDCKDDKISNDLINTVVKNAHSELDKNFN